MYLLLSSGLQAGLGFAFWILAARIFTVPQVGRATSLIAATTLIGFVALLGLNSTLIRYLPTVAAPEHHDHRGRHHGGRLRRRAGPRVRLRPLLVRTAPGLFGAPGAVHRRLRRPAAPWPPSTWSPTPSSSPAGGPASTHSWTAGWAAWSRSSWCRSWPDPAPTGSSAPRRAGSPPPPLVSLILIVTQLHHRPRLKGAVAAMRPLLRFSGANYLGNVFNLVPTLVVPLIVLDRVGVSAAAFYFVAFQVANLLYAGAYAVEQNFLAEGAHGEEALVSLMRRSAKVLAILVLPACMPSSPCWPTPCCRCSAGPTPPTVPRRWSSWRWPPSRWRRRTGW